MTVAQDSNRIRIRICSSGLRVTRGVKLVQRDSTASATGRISLFRSVLFFPRFSPQGGTLDIYRTYMRLHTHPKDARGMARPLHRPRMGQDRIDRMSAMYVLHYHVALFCIFCAPELVPLDPHYMAARHRAATQQSKPPPSFLPQANQSRLGADPRPGSWAWLEKGAGVGELGGALEEGHSLSAQ